MLLLHAANKLSIENLSRLAAGTDSEDRVRGWEQAGAKAGENKGPNTATKKKTIQKEETYPKLHQIKKYVFDPKTEILLLHSLNDVVGSTRHNYARTH